uniref:Uncharacterized protein n=1 Tax=Arundo donax TaxID=35708 RepID=A0A0A9A3W9_ARUDO
MNFTYCLNAWESSALYGDSRLPVCRA